MKTIQIQYVGPYPELHIEIGKHKPSIPAKRGQPVAVPEAIATELLQRDEWKPVPNSGTPAPALN